jgi:hypothetical protein
VNANTDPQRGRPRASQPTSVSPTSAGSGSRSWRLPLPRINTSPARQSMSDSSNAATSPARNPSRDSSVRIAKSRRPTRVRPSQLASSRATDLASIALTSDASRQLATDGTAPARSRPISPSTCRKRSSARSRVTMHFADPTLQRRDSRSTNSLTAAPSSSISASSPRARSRSARNTRATPT